MSRNLYDRSVGRSLAPGGIKAASWVTLARTGWGLELRGSINGGLRLLARETCTQRLTPGTTWITLPKTNPVRVSLALLPRDARGRIPTIPCLGDDAAL